MNPETHFLINPGNVPLSPLSLHGETLFPQWVSGTHQRYREACHFIRRYYRVVFGARINVKAKNLVVLFDEQHRLRAAVGLIPAEQGELFLEAYLSAPIEKVLVARTRRSIRRQEIMEVGSLAADGSGAGRLLFVALTEALHALRRDWIVFTGTSQVRTMFSRLGLSPVALASADPQRLGDDAEKWGRYYDHAPTIMYGHVPPGHQVLKANGWFKQGGRQYDVVA